MATLKRRLHRKNGSSYDTLHLETEASLVLMDDGTTTLSSKISSMDSAINKHASRHASNGSDPVTPAAIGAYPNGTIGTIDCNTLTDGCWTISANATNSPGSIACTLYHKIWNTDFASQIAFGADHNVYYRTKTSGSWTNWYEIYSELRYPSPAKIGAAAASHKHAAGDITSGTLAVARGGTGITSNPSMLTNLGSTSAASVFAASPRPGVTGTLPVANGGTGVTSIDALKSALGLGGGTQYSGMTYNLTGIAVGKPVLWGNEIWICVHVSGSTYYLSSTSIYGSTIFGSNNSYRRSTLAAMCAQFQNIIPADSLALAVNTTVNGVTAKIFCPSYEQYNGGFSYFNSDASRVCQASNYWTSSPASVGDVYGVSMYGNLYNDDDPSVTRGFRPCVALAL